MSNAGPNFTRETWDTKTLGRVFLSNPKEACGMIDMVIQTLSCKTTGATTAEFRLNFSPCQWSTVVTSLGDTPSRMLLHLSAFDTQWH